jgi:hypothetical protein
MVLTSYGNFISGRDQMGLSGTTHTVAAMQSNKQLPSLITKSAKTPFHNHNIQLPSQISSLAQPSPVSPLLIWTHIPQQSPHCITSLQTNLVPIMGFIHKVCCQSCIYGSIIQMALCYLEAICAKVPELLGKEKMELVVQMKPLCHMWHPQDTPHAFMTLLHATVAAMHSNKQLPCLITKLAKTPFHNHNIQLQSPIVP